MIAIIRHKSCRSHSSRSEKLKPRTVRSALTVLACCPAHGRPHNTTVGALGDRQGVDDASSLR